MRALVLALVSLGLASPLHAQNHDAGAEMLEAFFAMIGAGTPGSVEVEVMTGRLPATIEPALLPTGAVVLGGVLMVPGPEGFGVPNAVAMVRLDADPEAAASAYAAMGLPGGWTAEISQTYPLGGELCGPDQSAEVSFAPRREGGTYVALLMGDGPCESHDVEIVEVEVAPGFGPISLPDPFPQAAFADRDEQGFGYSEAGVRGGYQRIEVKEGTSVEAVAGLAADAFEADGWTRLGDAASGEALISTWTRTEAAEFDDQPHLVTFATVVVQPTGEGTVEVLVTATR